LPDAVANPKELLVILTPVKPPVTPVILEDSNVFAADAPEATTKAEGVIFIAVVLAA